MKILILNNNNNNNYNTLKVNSSEISQANNNNNNNNKNINNNNSNFVNNFLNNRDKNLEESKMKVFSNSSLFNKSTVQLKDRMATNSKQKIKSKNKDAKGKKLTLMKIVNSRIQYFCKLLSNKTDKDNYKQLDFYNKLNSKILKLFDVSEIFNKIEDINNIKHIMLDNDLLNIYDTLFTKINCEKEDYIKLESFINKKNKNALETKIYELFLLNRLE